MSDKMPPLPIVAYSVTFQGKHCSNYCERLDEAQEQKRRRDAAFGENGREVVPLVTEADARAYAAEQTRELVGALERIATVVNATWCNREWVEAYALEVLAKHKDSKQ